MTSLPPTHRALLQEVYGEPLLVKDLPTPQATSGSAVLKILCSPTISYMRDVYNGKRQYPYSAPIVPGTSAIARVAAVGSDATFLQPGELVYFDCMIHSRDDYDDAILIGLAQGGTESSKKMMEGGGGMGRLRSMPRCRWRMCSSVPRPPGSDQFHTHFGWYPELEEEWEGGLDVSGLRM